MLNVAERRAMGEKQISIDSNSNASTVMRRAEEEDHDQLPTGSPSSFTCSGLPRHHQLLQHHNLHNPRHHHLPPPPDVSTQNRVSPSPLRSSPDYSPSSASFSCSSDDGSPPQLYPPHHPISDFQTLNNSHHYLSDSPHRHHNFNLPCTDFALPYFNNDNTLDELGLYQDFYKLDIRGKQPALPAAAKFNQIRTDPSGRGFGFGSLDGFQGDGNRHLSMDSYNVCRDFNNGVYDSLGPFTARSQLMSDDLNAGYDGWSHRETLPFNPSPTRPVNTIDWSKHQYGAETELGHQSTIDAFQRLILTEWARRGNDDARRSFMMASSAADVDAFGSPNDFLAQGKSFNHSNNRARESRKKSYLKEISSARNNNNTGSRCSFHGGGGVAENGDQRPTSYSLLPMSSGDTIFSQVQSHVYAMAKDQNGCRLLQRIFDEGSRMDLMMIFNEIVDHAVELSLNQFGNYVIQKMLDVCEEEQRLQIVYVLTSEAGQLVKITFNTYGTRVVQKLVETLKTKQQISLVVCALKPGLRDVVEDQNGNHVVQSCLKYLTNDDNKFIFEAASKFCVDIATHQHGCCVMQKCLDHFKGKYLDKLVTEISRHTLQLSQDPFGNYVIQYLIEQEKPRITAKLLPQFEGHFVHLSMQKCSSNVVERCIKHCEESRAYIIHELISVSHFEQLLQDPFANYVIQTALSYTKGTLRSLLVDAIRPHSRLRSSPYCKRIFTRSMLKK